MKKGPLNATLDNGGVKVFPNDHAMGDVILHDGANNFVPGVIDARSMTFDNVRIIFSYTPQLISPYFCEPETGKEIFRTSSVDFCV